MRETIFNDRPTKKPKSDDRNILPQGWVGCPNFGHELSFIIPSKVPLDGDFDDHIPSGKRYAFRQVFHMSRVKNFTIGMVVDLTNTYRYYSSNEIMKQGLQYLKIRCQGRDSVPDNEAVNTFVFEVGQYIFNHPKKRVLVHCTHGHNRTGYMIVHYLMRTHQARSVTEAIRKFANARPPGIYKQDYIDKLYDFYHESKPDSVVCPPTPEWKRSCDDLDLNSEGLPEDGDSVSYDSVNEKPENNVMMTNDDVLGDKIPYEQEIQLRGLCLKMLGLHPPNTRGHAHFLGSHPVSLDRENLEKLRQRKYFVTWKADGTRYMLLVASDGCYLIDRNFKFKRIQMRFPCKNTTESHRFTLLDGEMIIDTISPGKQERRYLIYDVIAINGVSLVEQTFCERWNLIEKEVVEPRRAERQSIGKLYSYDLEPFRVKRKNFWWLSTVEKVLKSLIPTLSHKSDGLIFQCWDDPYVPRTHEGLLKWKYPKMNSVDFLFEVGEDGADFLYLYDRGKKRRLMENNRVNFGDGF